MGNWKIKVQISPNINLEISRILMKLHETTRSSALLFLLLAAISFTISLTKFSPFFLQLRLVSLISLAFLHFFLQSILSFQILFIYYTSNSTRFHLNFQVSFTSKVSFFNFSSYYSWFYWEIGLMNIRNLEYHLPCMNLCSFS